MERISARPCGQLIHETFTSKRVRSGSERAIGTCTQGRVARREPRANVRNFIRRFECRPPELKFVNDHADNRPRSLPQRSGDR